MNIIISGFLPPPTWATRSPFYSYTAASLSESYPVTKWFFQYNIPEQQIPLDEELKPLLSKEDFEELKNKYKLEAAPCDSTKKTVEITTKKDVE